jgi:hypothetical protein
MPYYAFLIVIDKLHRNSLLCVCFQLSCRGLILLNIMTCIMGTNWVVLKESNEAFDPVRSAESAAGMFQGQ